MMNHRRGLSIFCGVALFFLAACRLAPDAPTGVTATPGNTEAILSWPAVKGATGYNVYTSPSAPVTTGSTKISVATPGMTLSSLANGAVVYAAVTAVNAAGESPMSATVCAVPTAAPTAGLTLYDPLCGSTLDGRKWQTPLLTRGIESGELVLAAQASNMESRSIQGQTYSATATIAAGLQRVTALKSQVTLPAATASRTGNAEIRAMAQLAYQPPADRLVFPAGLLNAIFIQVGLADVGDGLRVFRRVLHCDNASCTSRSAADIAFSDPMSFTPRSNGLESDAAAAYDTEYTVSASLDESSGVFSWSIAGGAFGDGLSGTADPAAYLAGNDGWRTLGTSPLAGPGFSAAFLRAQLSDDSTQAGSAAGMNARFRNVHVGFNSGSATLWDDFSGTGGNSGPKELSAAKWTTPGENSVASTAGSLTFHSQTTGVNNFQGVTFGNPDGINTLQADVTASDCGGTSHSTKRVELAGRFYNDGTPGTTPPNSNRPDSLVGDVQASLALDCFAFPGVAYFVITRYNSTTPQAFTLLNNTNNMVPIGPSPVVGNTHTLRMKWDPVTHLLAFQVNEATPVVVDPTTVNAHINVAAPYVKPANSPFKQLGAFLFIPVSTPGATASMDFKVNNLFVAP